MDKYEYKVKVDTIKEYIGEGRYHDAAVIADGIDWRKCRSSMMLCTISDLYKVTKQYDKAKKLLLMAYEMRQGGKNVCYSLCEVCMKLKDYDQALNFYREFVQLAPKDPSRFVLQYKLYEMQGASLENRIFVLEELKREDYREKWGYELAYLYHRAGEITLCVQECDELILWFGSGKYVYKAMELKQLYEQLTPSQQAIYDSRLEGENTRIYEKQSVVEAAESSEQRKAEEIAFVYEDLPSQEDLSGQEMMSVQEDLGMQETVAARENLSEQEAVYAQEDLPVQGTVDIREDSLEQNPEEKDGLDIEVKPIDFSPYSTINLQKEIAEGLKAVMDRPTEVHSVMEEDDTARVSFQTVEDITEVEYTAEAADLDEPEQMSAEEATEAPAESENLSEEFSAENENAELAKDMYYVDHFSPTRVVSELTASAFEKEEERARTAQPPKELAEQLSQEADGQLRLVVPKDEAVEKQITGQISIEDVLKEWDRLQKEREEHQKERVEKLVQEHTGSLFDEFEQEKLDDLLARLENKDQAYAEPVEESADATEEYGEVEELAEIEAAGAEEFEDKESEYSEETEESQDKEAEYSEETEESQDKESEYFKETEESQEEESEPSGKIDGVEKEEEKAEAETALKNDDAETIEKQSVKSADSQYEPVKEMKHTSHSHESFKTRMLTEEEKVMYEPFIQSRIGRDKLIHAIDTISMAPYTGNIIVTGDASMDTLALAKTLIREVQQNDSNFSGKVAKITGRGLNAKDLSEIFEKVKNGALIVQAASDMTEDTSWRLYKALQQDRIGIIVVLEDTKKNINDMLKKYPDFVALFNARVDMEPLSNDTLVSHAKTYARSREYSIDEFGALALHNRIGQMQTIDHHVSTLDVRELVDEAIDSADRKNLKHFFDILFGRRYDDEDMIILTEEDFE